MVRLRTEKARLLGYPTWAHYRLDDAMAKTPEAARGLLSKVWAPARLRALADRDAMQEMIRAEGGNFALAPWDWRYYAEKLRRERCDLGEGEIEPYLGLDRIIEAAFETARRLFGITVTTSAPGRCGQRTGAISGYSSATISPGPPSAAAPGWQRCASRTSSTARFAHWCSTS
jgi:Zn-dependent oligopeptidase